MVGMSMGGTLVQLMLLGYVTCVRVGGDGSGHGQANELDCGSIRKAGRLRRLGVDPYQLDADRDGIGCQSS